MADVFTGDDGPNNEFGNYATMHGLGGDDQLGTFGTTAAVTFVEIYGEIGNDQLFNLDSLPGRLFGGADNDQLFGGNQYDWLNGSGGSDWLFGGLGRDELNGGPGRDHYGFNTAPSGANWDKIIGFKVNQDLLHFNNDIYTRAGPDGPLAASKFHIGPRPQDRNDFFGYNDENGTFWYDANGNQGGQFRKVAELDDGLLLTNLSIRID